MTRIAIPAYHIPLSSLRRLMALVDACSAPTGRRASRQNRLLQATSSLPVIGRAYQNATQEIATLKTGSLRSPATQDLRELEAHRHILMNLNAHLRQFGTLTLNRNERNIRMSGRPLL